MTNKTLTSTQIVCHSAPEVAAMDCSKCDHWNQGHGQPLCLKCKKYKALQIKSGNRESIKMEHLPQEIIDNMPDPRAITLAGVLAHLPSQYAVPLVMRALLNMSLQEIADYHNLSRPAIQQRIAKGINIITQSLLAP